MQPSESIDLSSIGDSLSVNLVTERERFKFGKLVLIGLSILYSLNIIAFIFHPDKSERLIDAATNMITSLSTIILMSYFNQKK